MATAGGVTLVHSVRIFDGERILAHDSVLLRDGIIAEIGDGFRPADADRLVDGVGGTLMPGLIDSHTHVFAGSLQQAIAFGVTTELDMFADPHLAASSKARARVSFDQADLRSAGTGATAPGGHPTGLVQRGFYPPFPTLSAPEEADDFVANRVSEGSDYLKIIIDDGDLLGFPRPTLSPEIVQALVAAAHRRGLLAIVHVLDHRAARAAAEAGADGLAHLPLEPLPPHLLDEISHRGMFVIPTLVALEAVSGHGHGPATARDPAFVGRLDETSTRALTMFDGNFPLGPGAHVDPTAPAEAVRELHRRRVPILAGTDAGTLGTAHGVSLHRELNLLVTAGLTPIEALRAATAAPAHHFRLADRGRILVGRRADLLLVDGDPTADITAISHIHTIWRNGVALAG
ncbi:MAG: amidohydrolase family protein [Leifsonia sp.]